MELQAHGVETTASPAYVTKTLANLTDVYLQASVTIPAAVVTSIASLSDGDGFYLMFVDLGVSGNNGVFVGPDSGVPKYWSSFGASPAAAVTADTPTLIDVRMQAGSPPTITIKINGSTVYGPTAEGNNNASFQTALFGICDLFTFAGNADWTIYVDSIKIGTSGFGSSNVFSEDFEGTSPLANFSSTAGDVSVVSGPTPTLTTPQGVCIAFDDPTLEPSPAWTRLDTTANLVASWTIDRGRSYELDQNDTGRATITINDTDGILDPLNASGPYYGLIEPLKQVALARYNPVTLTWSTRYRGFVESFDYTEHPSQEVMQLVIQCVDGFEILSAAEMVPGLFGTTVPDGAEGNVFYEDAEVDDRLIELATDVGWPSLLYTIFSGNVWVQETTYSAGESVLTAMLEAADAEFPGVANLYMSKDGKLTFHGRYARFNPDAVAAGATPGAWNFTRWKAGDSAAVTASLSDTAQIREISFSRGLARIINQASATPRGIDRADVAGQVVSDAASIATFGIRSWSADDLILQGGKVTNVDDPNAEAQVISQYYVDAYKDPQNRISKLTFKSLAPTDTRAAPLWLLLCDIEISDIVTVTVGHPGGGGFTSTPFFVEGIHEEQEPLNATIDMVTVTLDVSPQAYYTAFPSTPITGARATATAAGRAGTVTHT